MRPPRRLAAITLAAAPVLVAALGGYFDLASTDRSAAVYGRLFLLGCAVAAVALARPWWWGRLFAASMALVAFLVGVPPLVTAAELSPLHMLPLLWAAALAASLRGREMFGRFEGQPWLDWSGPHMTALRLALVANAAAVWVYGAALADGVFGGGCFALPMLDAGSPAYVGALLTTAALLAGVLMLAARKTAGLIILVPMALAAPVLLVCAGQVHGRDDARWLLLIAAPGIAAAGSAVAVWAGPIARSLRGR